MKNRNTFIVAVTGAAILATCVFAQEDERARPPGGPREGRNPAEMIKRSDTDGDGKVSKEEFVQARTAALDEQFGRMDANSDGFLDEAEIAQIAERMRSAMAGRGGFGGPGRGPGKRRPEGGPSPEQAGAFIDQLFERADQDANGQLSKEEFAQSMARMREMRPRGPGRPEGGEGGFRRPPRQGGEGAAPARPPLEGEEPDAPEKPQEN